jgi:hypothetical protein
VAGEERKMTGAVTGWKGDGCGQQTLLSRPFEQPSLLEQVLQELGLSVFVFSYVGKSIFAEYVIVSCTVRLTA